MNRTSPEMLHCMNNNSGNTEMSVLERQRARLNWQQQQLIQQQPITYFNENEQLGGVFLIGNNDQGLGELLVSRAMKPDPGLEYGWNNLNYGNGSEFEMNYGIPRTASCPPAVAAAMAEVEANGSKANEVALSSATGKDSFKKRKADKTQNFKVLTEEKSQEKRLKGLAEEDSKITDQNSNSKSSVTTAYTTTHNNSNKETSADNSKETSKVTEVPKPDYIHVRARRGQATDSHSLAARFGSGMQQDHWKSWNAGRDNQLCPISQGVSCCGLEMGANHPDVTLRRTISAPVSIPEGLFDSSLDFLQVSWKQAT